MKSGFITKCINFWRRIKREIWINRLRKKNHNHDFSLITNDCIGGIICHDLGEQFRSPMINVGVPNDCYLQFVQNLKYYLSCEVRETPDEAKPYPVGTIIPKDDQHIPITLNFVHDHTFEEALEKWKKRCPRVNYDRLYFIWHFYDDENTDNLKVFDSWDARKLAILHEPISGIRNGAVSTCYDEDPHSGKILDIIEKTGKRYLDEIDYIGFLNREG